MSPGDAPLGRGRAEPAASRPELLAALGFFALGTFLRAHHITGHELWIDEYVTSWAIAGESWREVWQRALEIQVQSPLYYLLVRTFVEVFGEGALALRLPSLVCGIALLGFAYVVAMRLFSNRRVALVTVAAFALDERLIFYSRDARPYAMALLCATASFFFYAELLRDERWRTRLRWILLTAATYYVHYLFGAILLVQALHYALHRPHSFARLRRDGSALAFLGVLMAPGALQLNGLYIRRRLLDWVPPGDGAFPGLDLALEFLDLRVLGLVCVALLFAIAIERPRSLRLPGSWLGLLLLWLGIPLLLVLVASPLLGVNLVYPRYVLVIVPAVALLYGTLAGLPRGARLAWLVAAVFVSATAVLSVKPMLEGDGQFSNWYRDQRWASATGALAKRYRDGDLVLYGTRFVELDAVVRGEARAVVTGFAAWPVRAHLPPERDFQLRALPYRYTPETTRKLLRGLGESAGRVWIIGLPKAVRRATPLIEREAGLQVAKRQRYGIVHLVLMTQQHQRPSPEA
ncbi:glycosyltransferase family 39 protein [bacterium]|nr:glycosyltransferase family 39 protein [bacterium]